MVHKKKPTQYQYKLRDAELQEVDHHPYLGVELSKNLTWAKHINQISTKANKMLGLLRRNLGTCKQSTKDIAYKTLVRPRLEYCSAVWDPHQKIHIDNLEKIQRRAARFVTNNYMKTSSVTKIIEDLKWDTLQKRRSMARLTVLHKETHSKIPSNIHHLLVVNGCKPQTRQHHNLNYNTIQTNKDCYRYSLYPRTIPLWNSLPPSVKSATNTCNFKDLLASAQI